MLGNEDCLHNALRVSFSLNSANCGGSKQVQLIIFTLCDLSSIFVVHLLLQLCLLITIENQHVKFIFCLIGIFVV